MSAFCLHHGLEGRGESTVLTAMIGDVTGKMLARSDPGETAEGPMELRQRRIRKQGRPLASDTDLESSEARSSAAVCDCSLGNRVACLRV